MNQDIIIEQRLLGGLLNYPERAEYVLPLIWESLFDTKIDRKIFNEIKNQYETTGKFDMVTVSVKTKEYSYISEIAQDVAVIDFGSYIKLLREKWGSSEEESIYLEGKKEPDLFARFEYRQNKYNEIGEKMIEGLQANSSYQEFLDDLDKNSDDHIKTFIPKMDNLLGGFEGGDMIAICARPSEGKTSLACCLAYNMVKYGKYKVDFHSLEMRRLLIRKKIIANMIGIDSSIMRRKTFDSDEYERIRLANIDLEKMPLSIINSAGKSIDAICFDIQKTKADVIFIDYLGMIGSGQRLIYDKITEISNRLKLAITRKGKVLLVCMQLNRSSEKEKRPPRLSDLRDSGAIEQDIDTALFIHCKLEWEEKISRAIIPVDIIVEKQRNDNRGFIELMYNKTLSRFYEEDNRHYEIQSNLISHDVF